VENATKNKTAGARIVVAMGEYVAGTAPDVLTTSGLGSCVGVAIYEACLQAGGLAHISEPGHGAESQNPQAHADIAIATMVAELEAMGGVRTFMVAKLAGGGEMFGFEVSDQMDIGKRNLQSVLKALENEMVRVDGKDVLGDRPRSMIFDLTTGKVVLESCGEMYCVM